MGGQNHQPTSRVRLIAPSALLSQKVGDAFVCVLQANGDLENAIMAGMDRLHVEELVAELPCSALEYMAASIEKLEAAVAMVGEIEKLYAHLLNAAAMEGYRGNPLSSRVSEFALSEAFSGVLILPAVNPHAWSSVETRVEQTNILRTLEWEAGQFGTAVAPMRRLIEVLNDCKRIAELEGPRAMVEAIECNEVSLRQAFARVFSLWNHLHAMFLYSALMMTELFYRTNAFGSLLSDEPAEGANAKATA